MRSAIAVVIVLAVMAGALFYAFRVDTAAQRERLATASAQPERASPSPPQVAVPAESKTPRHGNEIRICTAPDGSTVYTNALSCEAVDHRQRISVIQAPRRSERPQQAQPTQKRAPQPVQRSRAPEQCGRKSLHLFVPNPKEVPQSCKWSWGRAQEIERMLSVRDKPGESIWIGEYCARIAEVAGDGCRIRTEEFCFEQYCRKRRLED